MFLKYLIFAQEVAADIEDILSFCKYFYCLIGCPNLNSLEIILYDLGLSNFIFWANKICIS